MENIAPTKANLINAESSLEFSEKGFELLDKKRNVLIREIMSYVDLSKKLQEKINVTFKEAYDALRNANITMGIYDVEQIAMTIEEAEDYNVLFKSVMGVEIPHIQFEEKDIEPKYSFYKTNSAMDIAYKKFNEVRYLIFQLAEVENAVYRLAVEVKKTQKRANALENIQIPRFKELIKNISEVLEEKEREDFFRLKVVKKKKHR
ncbi:V/A-type H+-transporting ATPase subunit D [Clostridium tetanomorphum]|uniref:V-type ATP synthase subunit D n=1 Tax=Clostridium tetanomorphum TaxID=1553 RepID=A0A923EAJ7_CLOTT|nr:V-type ATP synthase subunit D [Clostridium tetanomorphum]KAJ50481.1 V-type sodium ATP synthase subunit D [Clostridium tetanomorphum DSM 665]MBC2398272.1 V-type ATP synthase subunit D [Clostridium tetanomorphum]MBP1865611.1 V/A-type H+-transporting ATPase subunit D [Clostridium tetanomorphum]NRS85883.1 V/A-type H+-transporting ATPase subunit D [Clostridium tetanomorphum]NRZ96107.1 V/A-type H+-transporting ATPase subunit D [Clostridium tetanomorphum]